MTGIVGCWHQFTVSVKKIRKSWLSNMDASSGGTRHLARHTILKLLGIEKSTLVMARLVLWLVELQLYGCLRHPQSLRSYKTLSGIILLLEFSINYNYKFSGTIVSITRFCFQTKWSTPTPHTLKHHGSGPVIVVNGLDLNTFLKCGLVWIILKF